MLSMSIERVKSKHDKLITYDTFNNASNSKKYSRKSINLNKYLPKQINKT
jgi:hypothetical protein